MKSSAPKNRTPRTYCILGRLVLKAVHTQTGDEPSARAIVGWLLENPYIRQEQELGRAVAGLLEADDEEQRRRIITLEGQEGQRFSLVSLDLPGLGQGALIRRAHDLSERLRRGGAQPGPLQLTSAAPEWLSSGAPQHLGGGGPGGHPRHVRSWPFGITLRRRWRVQPPEGLASTAAGEGAGVTVFILDTAPGAHAMARAYSRWAADNELVARLLGPASPLRVTYASYADLLELEEYGLQPHNYPMPDHGLFVAGIVHSLAPEARLELIEVLNPYGVGSTRTIAAGLRMVQQRLKRGDRAPVIVNCSLLITVLRPDDLPELIAQDPGAWGGFSAESFAAYCAELEQDVREQLEGVCKALADHEALVVAAAGNEARGGPRPAARFPAAFDQVVGVGAVDTSNAPAPYSNLSDEITARTTTMIATFGGGVAGTLSPLSTETPLAAELKGMLGIYIGAFPLRRWWLWWWAPRNRNGWAWWAGTSFATPVVAGILARLRSAPSPGMAPAAAVDELVRHATLPSGVPGELVLPVKQV